MQQILLFFIMLIAAIEAFFNGSQISTSNKRKISGFVSNARTLKSVNPVFGNMNFPVKIDTESGIVLPRKESTFVNPFARHKRFSNNGRASLKKLNSVGFFKNRKFLNKERRNSSRKLRLMRRKRQLTSSLPRTNNGRSYFGSENSSVVSLLESPMNSNKFYGKAGYPKSRSAVIKKKQIKYLNYLPFNSKHPFRYSNLRAKIKDFKRRRRIEPRKVKKRKRDAETVSVSQANVTRDVNNEKDLNEGPDDSLDDLNLEDLRPDFLAQHHDDSPSNWQKYLELNRQPVSPYMMSSLPDDIDYYDYNLDIPRPFVSAPRMNFRIPYDRKIYEDANLEGDNDDATLCRKSESDDVIEKAKQKKKKKKENTSESSRLERLKHMLDDVGNALKEVNGSKSKSSKKCGKGGGKSGDSEETIRAKIEVVLPLLSQISQEIGKRSSQLQRTTPQKKSNVSEEQGKAVKQNVKQSPDCSLDGFWLSNITGLEINLSTQPNLMLKVNVKSFTKDAPVDDGWSIHGLTLSKTEGPFMLAAICPGRKKMASFTGQCWVYEEEEHVYGFWTIFTGGEKLTDLMTAVETKIDVLRREKDKDEVT